MKDLKIELNIKSIMLFEQITGKSFYELSPEDIMTLIYSIVIVNNPNYKITQEEFNDILQNKKISKNLINKVQEELDFIQSVIPSKEEETPSEGQETGSVPKLTEIVTNLIVQYGLDVNYVMYDMELWELLPFSNAIENKVKADMTDKRFWTYLTILPHIDGKKCKTPEQLIPFPWEKEDKKEVDKEFLKENNDRIMNLFKQNKGNEE